MNKQFFILSILAISFNISTVLGMSAEKLSKYIKDQSKQNILNNKTLKKENVGIRDAILKAYNTKANRKALDKALRSKKLKIEQLKNQAKPAKETTTAKPIKETTNTKPVSSASLQPEVQAETIESQHSSHYVAVAPTVNTVTVTEEKKFELPQDVNTIRFTQACIAINNIRTGLPASLYVYNEEYLNAAGNLAQILKEDIVIVPTIEDLLLIRAELQYGELMEKFGYRSSVSDPFVHDPFIDILRKIEDIVKINRKDLLPQLEAEYWRRFNVAILGYANSYQI